MTNRYIVEKTAPKLRHEIKYHINHGDAQILSGRLKQFFSYDKHADSRGIYRVSSLYFDTPYDKALKEKIDGVRNREKFRLRYYNDQPAFMRLEKKMKTNGLCAKQSTVLTLTQAQKIVAGDIDFLLETGDSLLLEFYSKLKGQLLAPKTVVTYLREAFLYTPGNVRITIDRNLSTYTGPDCFFQLPPCTLNMTEGLAVLEVKYDAFLSEIVRLAIQDVSIGSTAYSKYAISRRYE